MREGIERKSCPVCGGQIVVSDFWMFSYDRLLGKHGKLLKKRTRSIKDEKHIGSDGMSDSVLSGLQRSPEHEGTTSEIKTRIVINGEELIALRNPDGSVGFIRSELLKPVEGELNKEFAQICVRPTNQDCRFIYAVKDGMILRALVAPMNIKDDVANDLDEIIAELMSRRQRQIVEKMHDDLQDLAAQEGAEKGKAND